MVYFFHRNFDQLKQLARHGCDYKREWKIAVTHFTRENSVSTCSDHEGSHKFQTTAKKKSLLRVGKNSTFPQGKTANCCHFSEQCEFCFIWSQKTSWVFSLLGFSIPGVCGEVRAGGEGELCEERPGLATASSSRFQPPHSRGHKYVTHTWLLFFKQLKILSGWSGNLHWLHPGKKSKSSNGLAVGWLGLPSSTFLENMLRHLMVIWKPFTDYIEVISSIEFLTLLTVSQEYLPTLGSLLSSAVTG